MKFQRTFTYGQMIVYGLTILLPGIVCMILNMEVFPSTSASPLGAWPPNIMTIIAICMGAVFVYYSSTPSRLISRFCLIMEIVLGLCMWSNLILHFYVQRGVSTATLGQVERNQQTSYEASVAERMNASNAAALKSYNETVAAVTKANRLLPPEQRKPLPPPPPVTSVQITKPTPVQNNFAIPTTVAPEETWTAEQWRQHGAKLLLWTLIIETLLSVVGGSLLAAIWKWDSDGDGVPQWVQNLPASAMPWLKENYPIYYEAVTASQSHTATARTATPHQQIGFGATQRGKSK